MKPLDEGLRSFGTEKNALVDGISGFVPIFQRSLKVTTCELSSPQSSWFWPKMLVLRQISLVVPRPRHATTILKPPSVIQPAVISKAVWFTVAQFQLRVTTIPMLLCLTEVVTSFLARGVQILAHATTTQRTLRQSKMVTANMIRATR